MGGRGPGGGLEGRGWRQELGRGRARPKVERCRGLAAPCGSAEQQLQNTGTRKGGGAVAGAFSLPPHTPRTTDISKVDHPCPPHARLAAAPQAMQKSEPFLGDHPKQDSLAEWSKALASGASPQGRGFEPHSCQTSHQCFLVGPKEFPSPPDVCRASTPGTQSNECSHTRGLETQQCSSNSCQMGTWCSGITPA